MAGIGCIAGACFVAIHTENGYLPYAGVWSDKSTAAELMQELPLK
jgi:hypothetical protein